MIIKISKAQWEQMGKKAGWIKTAALGLYEFDTPKSQIVLENSKKEFDAILESLKLSLENWQAKYVHYGSKDTASEEVQTIYIKQFVESLY